MLYMILAGFDKIFLYWLLFLSVIDQKFPAALLCQKQLEKPKPWLQVVASILDSFIYIARPSVGFTALY